jgi:SAM-dependent methyltransferase
MGVRPKIRFDMNSGTDRSRWGPLAVALRAYQEGRAGAKLVVRTDLGTEEEWPASLFFRTPDEFTSLEREAIRRCGRRVIDVGAGAGPHSLALQREGHQVLAVESLPEIAALLAERGVERVTLRTLDDIPAQSADTVLMLMNGLGLAGTLEGLQPLLTSAGRLLAPGGRIIADSTDPRHFLEMDDDEPAFGQDGRYGGEVQFQIEFDGEKGAPFPFVYVDAPTLSTHASRAGLTLSASIPFQNGTYLAILERSDLDMSGHEPPAPHSEAG